MSAPHDVAVIGAGVVGSAIARELVVHGLDVALIEAAPDVGAGTSKANTALWHTGFDAVPGSLEAQCVKRGHQLLNDRAAESGWALERTGAVLVAWDDDQLSRLPGIERKAQTNGYTRIRALTSDEVYAVEPHLGPGVAAGLLVPDEGLLDPWSITLQLATEAVVNGARLFLNASVSAIDSRNGVHRVSAGSRQIRSRWVVNAAGLGSDQVDQMMGHHAFTITPRRGQLLVFDKLARPLIRHIVLPVPTATTKGVLVAPTIYGNVLLGPTAEDLNDRTATRTTESGINFLIDRGRSLMPALIDHEVTAAYSGLRAATEHSDYCYEANSDQRYVRVAGIRSTGVSSALALAERVVADLGARGEPIQSISHLRRWSVPPITEQSPRPYLNEAMIARNADYGEIVCHCERTTLGEIRDARDSPIPPADIDGLRRRTRTLMGRCQGFYCAARVEALMNDGIAHE